MCASPPSFLFVLAAVFLVGCGAESPREAGARTAVEDSLSADYDRDRTKCTDNPAPWFIEKEATVFICAAKRNDGQLRLVSRNAEERGLGGRAGAAQTAAASCSF